MDHKSKRPSVPKRQNASKDKLIRHDRLKILPSLSGRVQILSKERNQPVPKLIADFRRQNLGSMEETILELYHSNLSVYQLMTLGDQLWGARFSLPKIANLHRHVIGQINTWHERPIAKIYPYVFLGGITLKCTKGFEKKQASILTALGVDDRGFRAVLGVADGDWGKSADWSGFIQKLKRKGLRGVRLFIGDRLEGLAERLTADFPKATLQNSMVQFRHDLLSLVPTQHLLPVEDLLDRIDAGENGTEANERISAMVVELKRLKLTAAAQFFDAFVWDSMKYLVFPTEHWRVLRSNSALMKLLRNICERTRIVGAFSDGTSAVHLVNARLRHIEATVWRDKRSVWGHSNRTAKQ